MPDSAVRPRHNPDEEWEALLRQLRRGPQPEPRPFFYSRVHALLLAANGPAAGWLPGWLRRPAYVAVLGALLVAVSGDGSADNAHGNLPGGRPAQPRQR